MTYAGRLDPMASGVLLALVGEEVKKKEKYLALDKEYTFEVLFGFSTDTHDILGKILKADSRVNVSTKHLKAEIERNLGSFVGEHLQQYPIYSSKTVSGKPLFAYARSGTGVEIPARKIRIKKLELKKFKNINSDDLLANIEKRVGKVGGDFRQKEILQIWRKTLSRQMNQKFILASFSMNCSSGTYVRVLADMLGKKIGIPSLAFSIKRTKVGRYVV